MIQNELQTEVNRRRRGFCPTCGSPLGDDWQRRDGATFAMGEALPAGASYIRKEPARVGDIRGDLLLPVGQSAVTAFVGALLGAVLGVLAGGLLGGVIGFFAGAALVFSVTWIILMSDHRQALWLVHKIEQAAGVDLNRDGAIGKPRTVRVEVVENTSDNTKHIAWYDLPASEEQLTQLAEGVFIKRQPFSRRALAGRGNPFSDPGFRALQTAMLEAELLWPAGDGPNAGYKLSPTGRQFLIQFLPGHQAGG